MRKRKEEPVAARSAAPGDGQGDGSADGEISAPGSKLPPLKHEDVEISFPDEEASPYDEGAGVDASGGEQEILLDAAAEIAAGGPPVEESPEYLALLEEKKALEIENQNITHERMVLADQLKRKLAEFENSKKRLERERTEFQTFANAQLITELLPFLDNLERALASAPPSDPAAQAFVDGVQLVYKQVRDLLAKFGVTVVDAQGALFDPNLHQAVGFVETDGVPEGHVADVMQNGYVMSGRLLRPATVRVASVPAGAVADAASESSREADG